MPRKSITHQEMSRRAVLGAGLLVGLSQVTSKVGAATIPDITHGSRKSNHVALTFHGAGPTKVATAILNELNQAHIQATIFAVGSWLVADPAVAKAFHDGGHVIGNHTMNHFQMKSLKAATIKHEIAGCQAELKKLFGSASPWFRPSGTHYSTALIRKIAGQYGYADCISYDVDSMDYQDPPASSVVKNVMNTIKPGSIVSLHLGHSTTVKALPVLIEEITNNKLMPVTIEKLLGK